MRSRISNQANIGRRVGCFVALLALLFSAPAPASIRDRVLPELQHSAWLGKDGAPSDLTTLEQTPDGFLWLGTEYGVFRFDGFRFAKADEHTAQHFPREAARALRTTRDGGLWVGFTQGSSEVALLQNGTVTLFQAADGKGLGTVSDIVGGDDGDVWFATARGLCLHKTGEATLRCDLAGVPEGPETALCMTRDGTLWLGSKQTLYARRKGAAQFTKMLDGLGWIAQIREAADGRLWLADAKGPVHVIQLDGEGNPKLQASISITSAGLTFDADGELWITTLGKGIRRLRFPDRVQSGDMADGAPELEQFIHDDGLSGNYAWPVLVGREGEVWVGTSAGIDRFQERSLVPANFPQGAHDFALAAGDDGAVWAGTTNHPLMFLRGRDLRELRDVAPEVTYVHRAYDGSVWAAASSGIYKIEDGHPVRIAPFPGREGEQIRAIVVDRSGVVWVFLNFGGVYRWAQGVWTKEPVPAGLSPSARPSAEVLDHDGNVWFGYQHGQVVVRYGEQTKVYGPEDGLTIGAVRTLYQGHRVMWIGGSEGLAVFENGRFRSVRASTSGELDSVSGIVETDTDDLWLRSNAGLMHYKAAAVRAALADGTLSGQRFDHLDGLPGQSAQISPLPTLVLGTDHRLWQATGSGVVWIDPAHPVRNTLPPAVQIESMMSEDQQLSLSEKVVLPTGLNRVQIHYTAPVLRVPERTRFRYRLDGVDSDWQDAGERREALYNNLAPGSYRFHLTAENEDSGWNPVEAGLVFEVPPLFYQTWWFRALAALVALSVLFAAFYLRMRAMLARITLLHQERMIERERIARELHDTLIQSVQALTLKFQNVADDIPRDSPARKTMEEALDRADKVMIEGRDCVSELRAPSFVASDLAQAIRTIGADLANESCAFQVTIEGMSRDLDPMVHEEVLRIAKEALANSFRHSRATKVETEIIYHRAELRLRFRDNGRGIDPEILAKNRPGHWGIPGMRERAGRIRAQLEFWGRPGAGTEIELRVPARIAYLRHGPRRLLRHRGIARGEH